MGEYNSYTVLLACILQPGSNKGTKGGLQFEKKLKDEQIAITMILKL